MEIYVENRLENIEKAVKLCDGAFGRYEKPIAQREGYAEYLLKISQNACFFIAKDTSICGCAAVYMNDLLTKRAYITLFAVSPACQKKGVGSLMMNASFFRAKACGMRCIWLEVKERNETAIQFYKKHGFTYQKRAGIDSIYMACQFT